MVRELSTKREVDLESLTLHHSEQVRALEEKLASSAAAVSEREGEVRRLRAILEDSREGLGSASQHIASLEGELSVTKKEGAQMRAQLGRRETECESLKVDTTHKSLTYSQLITHVDCMYVCMYVYNL